MLAITNLIIKREFKIKNFEEDKIATLNKNPGLRYEGKNKEYYIFQGNYFLKDVGDKLIESFGVNIYIPLKYPNSVPVVLSTDEKIAKDEDFHIGKDGCICFEHGYNLNRQASGGLRLYDFIEYYFPKYFSWILLKQNGNTDKLVEWAHGDKGTLQMYVELLGTNDIKRMEAFLVQYLAVSKHGRNQKCYCNSGKKIKYCHLDAINFLRSTSKKEIEKDLNELRKANFEAVN
jgi:hypothetical protein